jgi:hypothetical protein
LAEGGGRGQGGGGGEQRGARDPSTTMHGSLLFVGERAPECTARARAGEA